MTLADTQQAIWGEIDKGDADEPKRQTALTTKVIDSKCYERVLTLLRSVDKDGNKQITFSGLKKTDVKFDTKKKELIIEGTASILGRSTHTKITLTGDDLKTRTCVVDVVSFGACTAGYLAAQGLFTIGEKLADFALFKAALSLPPPEFTIESFQARSDTLKMRISGTRPKPDKPESEELETVVVLESPSIKLAATGFVLESFLFPDWTEPDVRFEVIGTFQLGKANPVSATVKVELPVGKTRARDLWRVTLTTPINPIDPRDIAAWVGVNDMFAQAPAEITKQGLPFGLKSFTVDFYLQPPQPPSIVAVQIVISIKEPWKILEIPKDGADEAFILQLNDIALNAEVVQPFTSRHIYLWVTGRLALGKKSPEAEMEKNSLDAVVSLNTGGRGGVISFSSLKEFTLENLSELPGGLVLKTLEIPGTLDMGDTPVKTGAIKVKLVELSFDFSLDAPGKRKLQSIRLAVATRLQCNLIPSVLLISDPHLSLDLTDPLNPPTQRVSVRLAGRVTLLEKFQANFEMERMEGRWIFAAQALDDIPLARVFGKALGVNELPQDLPGRGELTELNLTGLRARYATRTASQASEFSFSATLAKVPKFKVEAIEIPQSSLSVDLLSVLKPGAKQRETSMMLRTAFRFADAPMALAFSYNREWGIVIEALGLRGKYDSATKTAQIELGDKKIGDIIRNVYTLVAPGATARLPEPWNELEGISLAGTKFTIDFANKSFGVTRELDPECDLIFARLQEIGVNYNKTSGVRMTVKARLLGAKDYKNYDFDPQNPGPDLDPVLPSTAKPIDLHFLALGQRLALPQPGKERVGDVLKLMKKSFTGANPTGHPLAKPLKFDAQRGLLLGAHFSLFGTLSTALVFNDGVVAGVSLGLSGPRARYFRGLDFEILYKKVSEGLGVYQIDLQVPDAIRQIELGAVSITIPQVALEIYTNGNFRVDLGFPKKNDFSRSFQLQVFPYLGSGGFYFALLGGATAPRLPADRDKNLKLKRFRPALAFGLGLSIGLGKSINRGMLAAELSLSFVGVLEGTLVFFNGAVLDEKTGQLLTDQSVPDSLYYWMQGTFGIVGRIRGRVSFSVITAEVSLVVESRVGVTLESFQPLVLSFTAAVNIDLVVKIGTGWLSVDIYCSFAAEIDEQITIPVRNPGMPAWAPRRASLAPKLQRALPPGDQALLADTLGAEGPAPRALLPSDVLPVQGQAQVASPPIPSMTWNPIELPEEEEPDELRLLFRPQFTMAEVNNEQIAHCVALLFLQSVETASIDNPPQGPPRSDFDRLAEAMLLWCINSLPGPKGVPLRQRQVSAEDLRGIYRVLTQKGRGAAPFTGTQVADFLRRYFRIVIESPTRPEPDGVDHPYEGRERPQVAIFPMIPELRVEARVTQLDPGDFTKDYEQLYYAATFDEQTIIPLAYHDEILAHFERLASEFRAEIEKAADASGADPQPEELAPAGGRSIAEFVFEDYFLLIARDVIQRSLDLWSARSGYNDTIAGLCFRFDIEISELAGANANAAIRPGVEVVLGGGSTITAGDGDTLQSVAEPFDVAVENLAELNKDTRGFFASGQKLSLRGTLDVETLIKELPKQAQLRPGEHKPSDLAGMTSRLMLPGIRLPKPSYLADDVRGLWLNGEPAPLYALTGQQFALPKFDGTDGVFLRCDIDLTFPERSDIAGWYVMAGEADKLTIPLLTDKRGLPEFLQLTQELAWIERVRLKRLSAPIELPQQIPMSRVSPRRFPLGNRVKLETTQRKPSGAPTLWMLPEGLRQALSTRGATLAFSLEVAVQTSDNSPALFREAAASWATALTVSIRKVVLPQPAEQETGEASPPLAYEIDGVDAEGLLLLEEILRKAGSNSDASFIKEIHILYRTQAADGTPALTSDRPDSISAFILRTNLSTLTGPQSSRAAAARGEAEPDVKLQMLRLLWQASSVRSGGYYLYYSSTERGASEAAFPDNIFDGKEVATITVLVMFDFRSKGVPSFVNRAVVGEATTANTKLVATSDPKQLFVRQPLLPPGHTGLVVQRRQPVLTPGQIDPDPQQQLEFLFSLLGCRVVENPENPESPSFKGSIEVPADGPEGDELEEKNANGAGVQKVPLWKYTKVIPFFKFSSSPATSPVEVQLPDPFRNPYRGIGQNLPVSLEWFDGFGNKTLSPFRLGTQPDTFELHLGYTDELIGVERWPGVSAGYSVRDIEGDPEIYVQLDFDVSRYTPLGQGQRTVADAKKVAQADLEVFRKIYYQLTWGTTQVWLHTTIDNLTYVLDSRAVIQFIGAIFKYLDSIGSRLYAFATDVGRAGQSLNDIPRFSVSPKYLEDLQRLNPGLPSKLTEDTAVVLPNLTLPQRLVLSPSPPITLSNPEAMFPLTVKFGIERFDHVDVEFQPDPDQPDPDRPQDPPGPVKVVAHELEPLPIVAGNSGGLASGAIRDFARTFEGVFPTTKLATGLSRPSDVDSDSRNRLWVVRTDGEKGIRCKVDDRQQYFFAPTPLATTLLSGTNQEGTESYLGIDLDEWARRFLSAIDTFFLPQYAVPAYILASEHYKTIMMAKSDIAGLIADSVEGIAEGTGGDREQAKELLRQRMLVRLSSACDVDTIVQIGVLVESPFDFFPENAPKFYGQPVAELPEAAGNNEKLDFTLSTAKLPLVDGPSYLTFLFDSEKVEPEQMLALNLSYKATALEYDISDLPGVQDAKSSSWLTFIIPEKVIPDDKAIEVNIPIPIRAHPIPPTVDNQGIGSVQLSEPNPKLEETRQYAYSYQYSRIRSGHDLVYTSPRFNSVKPGQEAKREAAAQMDLFQALAKFDRTWDAIRQNLLGTLPELNNAITPEKVRKTAKNALVAFADLVSTVAKAWSTWNRRNTAPVGPEQPGDREKYEQKQVPGDYVISEKRRSEEDDEWQIIVRKCEGPADAPIPGIEIEGWQQEEIDTTSLNERPFQYLLDGVVMREEDARANFARTLVFQNFDILNMENAWPEIRMTRNETLFGDVACVEDGSPRTNPSFVYHTPWVRFAEILKPRLEYGQPIDIAKLPEEPRDDLTAPSLADHPASLEDHLARLFKRLFETVKTAARRIQLTCRYQYDLDNPSEQVDPLVITLPIVMAPPFDFTIPDGKNETGRFFPQSLSEAIKDWLDDRHPSGKNGRFVFDISVYSSLGDAKLPVYRVSNLQLSLKDIKKDPVEGE